MEKIIGIDIGTTKITASVIENGKPVIISTRDGFRSFSTIAHVDAKGNWITGQKAKEFLLTDTEHTVLTGINYICNNPHTKKLSSQFLYPNTYNSNKAEIQYNVWGAILSSSDIITLVLKEFIQDINNYLDLPVSKVIVSIPVSISRKQKLLLRKVFENAGLNIIRMIDSPTAIACNYEFEYQNEEDEEIVVFDLGAESLSMSLTSISNSVCDTQSLIGAYEIGGNYFTLAIIEWIMNECKFDTGLEIAVDANTAQILFDSVEKAKICLSSNQEVTINIEKVHTTDNQIVNISKQLTQNQFEQICTPLLNKIKTRCTELLHFATHPVDNITKVIISGGASRMHCIQKTLLEAFKIQPTKAVNPEDSNANGCAIMAGLISGEIPAPLMLDIIPFGIGYKAFDGSFCSIIKRNTACTESGKVVFTTSDDNQTSLAIDMIEETGLSLTENSSIETIIFDGIPPQPKGIPKIEITVQIDPYLSLYVNAKDLSTNREINIDSFGEKNNKKIVNEGSTIAVNNKKTFCPDCGSPQQTGNIFCSDCGHRL